MRTEVIGRGGFGDVMFVPRPGFVVSNRYALTEVIGRGGMGEVWKAHDRELDSPCAVKFIVQHLASDRGIRDRFAREARAVARLRSPHVVHILGVGEVENIPYLAMELLDGETLLTRLERIGRLHPAVTLALVEQVAEALESAHHAEIVHRDLKPDNIWFWSGNKVFVKVLDFGVAKTGLTTESLQTATGALVGTPQYMSPEQALGNRDVDHRSDLWSLAVITMECLSGRRAFDSTGLGDLLLKIVGAPGPTVQDLAPHLPASLQEWWSKALARDPRDRFQSASELVNALRPHLAEFEPRSGQMPVSASARPSGLPFDDVATRGGPEGSLPQGSGSRARVGTDPGGHNSALQPLPISTPAISAQPVSTGAHSVQPPSAQLLSAQPLSAQPYAAQPFSAQPLSGAPEAWNRALERPSGSAAATPGVAVGKAQEAMGAPSAPAPSLGSVGPLSSSRSKSVPRGNRHRTLIAAAAILAVAAVVTLGRMFLADDATHPAPVATTPPAAAPPAAGNVTGEATPPQPAAEEAAAGAARTPTPAPGQAGSAAPATEPSPWDQALRRTGKPPEPQSAVETLRPRTPPAAAAAAAAPAKAALNGVPPASPSASQAAPAHLGLSPAAAPSAHPPASTPPAAAPSSAALPAASAAAAKKPASPAPINKPSAAPPARETPDTDAAKKQRTEKLKRMIGL